MARSAVMEMRGCARDDRGQVEVTRARASGPAVAGDSETMPVVRSHDEGARSDRYAWHGNRPPPPKVQRLRGRKPGPTGGTWKLLKAKVGHESRAVTTTAQPGVWPDTPTTLTTPPPCPRHQQNARVKFPEHSRRPRTLPVRSSGRPGAGLSEPCCLRAPPRNFGKATDPLPILPQAISEPVTMPSSKCCNDITSACSMMYTRWACGAHVPSTECSKAQGCW